MPQFILRFFSIIFNPLLMPTYGIVVILNSGTYLSYLPSDAKNLILTIYFISTILIPLSSFPFLYYQKIIKNWELSFHKDRVLPLLILSTSNFFGWYLISKLPIPRFYISYLLFLGIMFLITALLSIKWKICVHTVSIGGLIGLITSLAFKSNIDMHLILIISIISAGLLSFSRLALNENKGIMVYSGLILGFLMIYIPIIIS